MTKASCTVSSCIEVERLHEVSTYTVCQASFPWGPKLDIAKDTPEEEKTEFDTSCCMNALLYLATAEYVDLVTDLPDHTVQYILSRGRDCMCEWATKVLEMQPDGKSAIADQYFARPDEVAGQLSNNKVRLGPDYNPIRSLFQDAVLQEICEKEQLSRVLDLIHEDLASHPHAVGYLICIDGKMSALAPALFRPPAMASAAGRDFALIRHFDSHRQVVDGIYPSMQCQSLLCKSVDLKQNLMQHMLKQSEHGVGAYEQSQVGGAWRLTSTASSLDERCSRTKPPWLLSTPLTTQVCMYIYEGGSWDSEKGFIGKTFREEKMVPQEDEDEEEEEEEGGCIYIYICIYIDIGKAMVPFQVLLGCTCYIYIYIHLLM